MLPTLYGGIVITQVLHCPYCQGTDIVRHGTTPEGKQRYRCRECLLGRGRTFLLEYTYAGQLPGVKQQIVDMAMNASGIRDTARGTRAYGERGGRMSATLQGVVRLPLSSDSLVSVRAQFFDHLVVQPKD